MPATPDPALLEQLRAALDSTYEIERELGGGMSRVFVATERALGRKVVLKVLPPELTAGVNRDRFRREIQFAARLQHPHIVPLLTAGQISGTDILYYTMPLVDGETLRDRLDREGRLDAARVLAILQDIVDALAYAHARGLIHRDIKPENVLLQRNHALITDFGVAKAISEALPGTAATTVGIAVGTPAYMAPEQLAADPAADHRIDLYAVGLLAYELLSGSSPFSGSSPQKTLARQLTERPAPLHIERSDVPPALSAVIMRCLEKEPSARWESADELLKALGDIRITSSGMAAITRTLRLEAVPRGSRRRALTVGIGAALITLVIVGAYARWGRVAPAAPPAVSASSADSASSASSALSASSASPTPAPALTRADSLAIAAALARQITQKRPAPAPTIGISAKALDSIRAQVERSVTDSVLRMLGSAQRVIYKANTALGVPGLPPPPATTLGPQAPRSAWTETNRAPLRILVLDVTDVSPEHSLGDLAASLTDSLASALHRRPRIQVFHGTSLKNAERVLDRQGGASDPLLGMMFNADVVLRSSLGVRRGGDSVIVFVAIYDVREQRYSGSIKRTIARSDAASMPGALVPAIGTWLDQHVESRPGLPGLTMPGKGTLFDSTIRRLRDSLRKRPTPRHLTPDPYGLSFTSAPGHFTRRRRASKLGPSPSFLGISAPSEAIRYMIRCGKVFLVGFSNSM